jgi:catechol 2,3-dioxygenase-like lactoylglutathione lyase family enzyme
METSIANLLSGYEQGKLSRRQLIQALALMAGTAGAGISAPPPAPFPASSVNHIAITVSDLKKSTEWYKDLFGLKPEQETDAVSVLAFGNTVLVLRPGQNAQNAGRISHFCFGVKGFKMAEAEAELKKRGLNPRKDNESYHVTSPDGTDIQISDPDAR